MAGAANGDELCSCSGSACGLTRTKGEREMDRDGSGELIRWRTRMARFTGMPDAWSVWRTSNRGAQTGEHSHKV